MKSKKTTHANSNEIKVDTASIDASTQQGAEISVTNDAAEADWAREQRIATAAYFLAEQRGFFPGNEMDDWLVAEAAYHGSTSSQASA